ncbi:MAG: adenosylcobinamide amidohydrolase [Acidimicrobiales bacterium]
MLTEPIRTEHADGGDGARRPALVWRFESPVRCASTSVLGGGLGERSWIVNAEVALAYHYEPLEHLGAIAVELGLDPLTGVGLLTAARVLDVAVAADGRAVCAATVGVSTPTWAAAADGEWSRWAPDTINVVCWVPVPLSDAALLNLVVTATEAKSQALVEAGVPGTGTASDAVVVCTPTGGDVAEPYGGPRSPWGGRLARAVHAAVRSRL